MMGMYSCISTKCLFIHCSLIELEFRGAGFCGGRNSHIDQITRKEDIHTDDETIQRFKMVDTSARKFSPEQHYIRQCKLIFGVESQKEN